MMIYITEITANRISTKLENRRTAEHAGPAKHRGQISAHAQIYGRTSAKIIGVNMGMIVFENSFVHIFSKLHSKPCYYLY
jgi:hypothetical protein